ncbi:MAG: site-specific integrase [Oscillospiraceae bacterium]|nr:site-specific integrase [Oscillospiraceae bacterium]MBR3446580.1 site-specific integrase [Oscillospiraceae bacterium]
MVFDFKDDNGERRRKWVSTGLSEKCTKKALAAKVEEIIGAFYEDFLSGKATKAKHKRADRTVVSAEALAEGVAVRAGNCLFVDFLSHWLDTVKPAIAYTTYCGYIGYIEKISTYFNEKYPELLLCEITPLQIQQFYNDLYNSGLTGNTVKHYHANIHKALKYAVKMDMLESNPADKVELPKLEKYKACFYSKEELNKLLAVFKGDRMELVVHIAAYYGLRRSEVIGLKWDAIDFEKKTIKICRKVTSQTGSGHEEIMVDNTLKTEASVRTLPLIPHIERMLIEQQQKEEMYSKLLKSDFDRTHEGFVCRDPYGKLITPNFVTDHFKNMIKKHGLRRLRFHDLRHSCASLLLANGESMKAIQDWLGHSTFNVTANFYSHLDYTSRISSAETIARVLGDDEDEENEKTAGSL